MLNSCRAASRAEEREQKPSCTPGPIRVVDYWSEDQPARGTVSIIITHCLGFFIQSSAQVRAETEPCDLAYPAISTLQGCGA